MRTYTHTYIHMYIRYFVIQFQCVHCPPLHKSSARSHFKKHVLETEVLSALRALQFADLEPEGGSTEKQVPEALC